MRIEIKRECVFIDDRLEENVNSLLGVTKGGSKPNYLDLRLNNLLSELPIIEIVNHSARIIYIADLKNSVAALKSGQGIKIQNGIVQYRSQCAV